MKRFAIAAAVVAGLLWGAGTASAQYRPNASRGHTMSGRNLTMSGHIQTNHNHLIPRPVGVTSYSPQYSGVVPGAVSPYSAGAVVLPNAFPLGVSVYPGGNYYNPSVWGGPAYPAGGTGSLLGGTGWRR